MSLVCPNKNTDSWRELMDAVEQNEVDATEAWAANGNEVPVGEELEKYRVYYKKARKLRSMDTVQLLNALKKEKASLFSMYKGRLFVKKNANMGEVDKLFSLSNKKLRKTVLSRRKAQRFGEGGREIWYVEIDGQTVFKQKDGTDISAPDPKIEGRLKELMVELGIKLENYDEYKEWYEDTYQKPLNAIAAADLMRKVITVKEGKADRNTLPEEVSHFILYALKDDPKVIEALSLIESTEEWKNHSESYIEDYEGNMPMIRLEILGKLMAKQLGDTIVDERPIWKRTLDRIWNSFLRFFTFGNSAKEARIKSTLDGIVNEALGDTTRIKEGLTEESSGVFKQLDTDLFKNSKILNPMKAELKETLSLIKRKVDRAQKKGVKSFTEREQRLFKELQLSYNNNRITQGLINFISHAEGEAESIISRLVEIEESFDEGKYDNELPQFTRLLRDMNGYISTYKDVIDSILSDSIKEREKLTSNDENAEKLSLIINSLQNISTGIVSMNKTYEHYGKQIYVHTMKEFVKRRFDTAEEVDAHLEDLIRKTDEVDKDISWWRKMLDSAAESTDEFIMLADRLYKEELELANIETDDIMKDLIDLDIAVKEAGVENTEFMLEKDENGIPTGNFITSINESLYQSKKSEFFTELYRKYGLPTGNTKADSVKRKRIISANSNMEHDIKSEIAKWYSENHDENPEWKNLVIKKRESIYNRIFIFKKDIEYVKKFKKENGSGWIRKLHEENHQLGVKAKRAEEILSEWISKRKVSTLAGDISYRKEFAKPKQSIYGNPAFSKLTPAQKIYYNGIMDIRKKLTSHMNEVFADSILVPQIRKDSIERIKSDPKRTIPEMMRDAFKVREDATDRGTLALDENDRPIKQIPLFFFNKLDNMNDLSTDITASMIMFADMANRHKHLNRISDILELGADILRTRKVKSKAVIPTIKDGSLARTETITEGGNAFERYQSFLDMSLYGERVENEGEFLGLDKAKVADALNRYTAINSLALNVYAGFQNIILGNIMVRQEAFVNEFVDHKDVLYADKKYWQGGDGIGGVLRDIGKVRSESKLRLFMELFDVLQDHESRASQVNTDRSRWARMFDMSALFFVNHAGEHQMQGRMAIALAHKKKVLNSKGEEIPLYEALYVDNYRLKVEEGTKNLDGSDFTNKDIASFKIRMKAINQRLHGIYNNTDKSAIQKKALGRMVMLFRKWMKPGYNRRFDDEYYNYSLESDVEGFYTTTFNFFNTLRKELQEGKLTLASSKEHYSKLSDTKKANLRRSLAEVSTLMGALAATMILDALVEGMDDDDEVAMWVANMSAYQANRLVTEIGFYVPVLGTSEALKIVKSPAAAINQIDLILDLGKVIDPMAFFNSNDVLPRYQKGRNKGDLKLKVWGKKLVPMVDTVEDFFYPEDRLKFFTQ